MHRSAQFSFKTGSLHATFRDEIWSPPSSAPISTICKIFHRADADSFLEAFLHNEASKASPGVVTFYEQFFEGCTLGIRLENCKRGPLSQELLNRHQFQQLFDLSFVISSLKGCLETLANLQIASIAHRQIDLTNMLLTESGEVKIMDFGKAKLVEQLNPEQEATVIGYESPGLLEAGNIGDQLEFDVFKEDAWSLGKAFYEICTLRPFRYTSSTPVDLQETDITMKLTRICFMPIISTLILLLNPNVKKRGTAKEALGVLIGEINKFGRIDESDLMHIEEDFRPPASYSDPSVPSTTHSELFTSSSSRSFEPPPAYSCCEACSALIEFACRVLECQHFICDKCVKFQSAELGRVMCVKCNKGPNERELRERRDLSREEKEKWVRIITQESTVKIKPVSVCTMCVKVYNSSGEITVKKCSNCVKLEQNRRFK